MSTISVRRAEAADAPQISALVRGSGSYQGRYGSIIEDFEVTPEYIDAHPVYLAADGAALLGFYALLLEPGELDLMFVSDAAQGRGVGRELVRHMLGEARTADLSVVRVVSHPPAEGFYRRLGAVRTGTAPATPPRVPWERPELMFLVGTGAE